MAAPVYTAPVVVLFEEILSAEIWNNIPPQDNCFESGWFNNNWKLLLSDDYSVTFVKHRSN